MPKFGVFTQADEGLGGMRRPRRRESNDGERAAATLARVHERQAGARRHGREREGHDGVHVADDPRVAELPMPFDLEAPAVHDAVPPGVRLRLERERGPRFELELDDSDTSATLMSDLFRGGIP
jgi:hypothetical protein